MNAFFSQISTVQGLILASLAAFIAVTLLISWIIFRIVTPKSSEHEKKNKQGSKFFKAPVALARLKAELELDPAKEEPFMGAARIEDPSDEPASARRFACRWARTLSFHKNIRTESRTAKLLGCDVAAVFFDPVDSQLIEDDAVRLLPFAEPGACRILATEKNGAQLKAGELFSQPDALVEIPGAIAVVEYKSRGGRLDSMETWASEIREKDVVQTYVHALAAGTVSKKAAAPILRTNNALYFIRPTKELDDLVEKIYPHALALHQAAFPNSGISASDFAQHLLPIVSKLWPKPESKGSIEGRERHREFLNE